MTGAVEFEHLAIEIAGHRRTFTVARPKEVGPEAPLVALLHGSNQTAKSFRRFTGGAFDEWVLQYGAVLVYLDGYRRNWNAARREQRVAAAKRNIDDTGYVTAVVDHLTAKFALTSAAVFALGYSAGGQMVIRLIHESGALLRGAAIFSATQPAPGNFMSFDSPVHALPVVFFHGTADRLVPYDGGMATLPLGLFPRGEGLSAPQTASYYAARNGISAVPTRQDLDGHTRTQWSQPDREPVVLYTVAGGGHTIPGPHRAARILGPTSPAIFGARTAGTFLLGPSGAGGTA